jgi:hypothetical protein
MFAAEKSVARGSWVESNAPGPKTDGIANGTANFEKADLSVVAIVLREKEKLFSLLFRR